MATTESPLAGVYVHIPYCARICPYCDFAVTRKRPGEAERLVAALVSEIELRGPGFQHPVDTIYFGGGTPSILSVARLGRVIDALGAHLDLTSDCRLHLEANPEDVDPVSLEAWRGLGVETLSLGVQAFDAGALRFLGRGHTPDQALAAVELALSAGFATVSVDLMYALPSQTAAEWTAELDRVLALGPDHLSCYQLTVHSGTPFGRLAQRGRLEELSATSQADLLVATHERLASLGWDPYEVSNFARSPQHRSRHNSKYWTGAPYLGIGPSAHSFDEPERSWNLGDSREYLQALEGGSPAEAGRERLSPSQRLLEEVMLGLRTAAGIDLGALGERYGQPLLALNRERVEGWEVTGWVSTDGGRLRPTPRGLAVADALASRLALGPDQPRSVD